MVSTFCSSGDESVYNQIMNEVSQFSDDEGEGEKPKLMRRETNFELGGYKFRRDSPYNEDEKLEASDAEQGTGKDSWNSFDDARFAYILNNMQTRDVDGQIAAAAIKKTASNGK